MLLTLSVCPVNAFAEYGLKDVEISEANFPDENFRRVLKEKYDEDHNGVFDEDELIKLRNIWCNGEGIKSLKGIELLPEVRGLYCMDNQIEDWDLSHNKLLTGIWCSGNKFTSLDFSDLPDLEWVYCFDCQITSLNVSKNPKMSYIECNSNPLQRLNVSNNPLLEHLMCGDCGLSELDLSHNPKMQHLDAFRNDLTSLDVTCCPKMKRLDIWDNHELGSIDVTQCPELQYYNCANNGATSVDVTHNTELTKLDVSYNRDGLTKLDITHNPKLAYLKCECNGLAELDITHNPELYYLMAFTNPFTTLNIGNNRFLVKTYKEGVKAEEYEICKGHSWTIDYGGDTSTGGDNIYFLCFDDAVDLKIDPVEVETPEKKEPEDIVQDPEDLLTREVAVQSLYELAGKPDVSGLKSRFTDVVPGAWYEDALLWGEKNAMFLGFPDTSSDIFGVGEYVTRQDLMLMLMRYCEAMNYKRAIDFGRSDDYIDALEVDHYAWEAVCWANTWNIMNRIGEQGADKSEQYIKPHRKATREDFNYMVGRMFEENNVTANISIAVPNAVKGDVNADGRIDIEDAVKLISHVNGQRPLTNDESKRADIDGSSIADIEDAVAIIAHVNGIKSIS